MNTDLSLALVLIAAAAIGWLTAAASLYEMRPGRTVFLQCWHALQIATADAFRGGVASVDAETLRRAVRPVVRCVTSVMVFAAAPAAIGELVGSGRIGVYGAVFCLSIALTYATTTPCPWLRFVFHGDRRRSQHPLNGEDRRAE